MRTFAPSSLSGMAICSASARVLPSITSRGVDSPIRWRSLAEKDLRHQHEGEQRLAQRLVALLERDGLEQVERVAVVDDGALDADHVDALGHREEELDRFQDADGVLGTAGVEVVDEDHRVAV